MDIGSNIKYIRKKESLTQKDFAQRVGISRNALINYENNKRLPSIELIEKISNTFGINLYDLLESNSVEETFYKNIYKELRNATSIKRALEILFLHNEYLNTKLDAAAPRFIDKKYFFEVISEEISKELSGMELLNMPKLNGDDDGEL